MDHNNKMGTMSMGKLLFSMSIPMMMSMLVQALYNVVDSIFVARLSEDALTAVSLAFPITNLMISFGVGTGVGVNALCSRYLGAKSYDKANSVASHGIWLAIITSGVFMLLIGLFVKPFFYALAESETIVQYGLDYTYITGFICIGLFFQTMTEKMLMSTGKSVHSMIVQLTGAVINIILDPIFIFGLFGFPRMEVAGAALATVIGQLCGGTLGVIFNIKLNPQIHVSLKKYPLSIHIVKEIYGIGIPSIILAAVGSIMNFGLNKVLMGFSSTASAVFGIYFRLQSFVFMPIFGLNNGLIPIIGFNYGARDPVRIKQVLRYAYAAAISIMCVGFLIFQFFSGPLLTMFNAHETMEQIGMVAFRIISICFIPAGFCIISTAFFQALGHAVIGMMVSILRQLIILLPATIILARIGGLNAVWWAFPLAEAMAVILCSIYLLRIQRHVMLPMEEEYELSHNAECMS